MSSTVSGLIVKGIGGFYYVETADGILECRARGVLRKQGITPAVGDRCTVSQKGGDMPMVDSIEPRRNFLIRPPVANIDKLFVVVSACKPSPNMLIIDRLIASAENVDIQPVVVLTKLDLADGADIARIYRNAGLRVIEVRYDTKSGIDEVRGELSGCISAFAGNSGVGKSTLLNAIEPDLRQKTAQISDKLGRGRHTTRSVELFSLSCGGRIADTPGFSSFDGEFGVVIDKDNLQYTFREFGDYLGMCKFTSCAHTCEKGCAIVEAVKKGDIERSRHESYCALYEEAKSVKPWENK
ncbi:MAG: ribosome small subunit-dependent GTPase A [Clostridia bacterium]|nr:ribosome small subunit-dependent GTPase A [Clostridia bacterium]MBQ9994616.1 ribosome small subunit-dependent GTPase A [Clostridia bacterium]